MLRAVNRILVRQSNAPKRAAIRLYSTSLRIAHRNAFAVSSVIGVSCLLLKEASCEIKQAARHEVIRDDLPYFTDEDLALHDNKYRIENYPGVDTSTFDVIGNACEVQR
jgi:hypothetical protein